MIFLKDKKTGKKRITDNRNFDKGIFFALFPCLVMAWYFYGVQAIHLMLWSVSISLILESLGGTLLHAKEKINYLNASFIGLTVALLLPANAPIYLVTIGCTVAILIFRIPFMRLNNFRFAPAAAGIAFLCFVFPDLMFSYPKPIIPTGMAALGETEYAIGLSVTQKIKEGIMVSSSALDVTDLLTGLVPGAMGATCILILFGILIYLLIRYPVKFLASFFFLIIPVLYSIFFMGENVTPFVMLSSNMFMFAAVFFVSRGPAPNKPLYAIIYGACGGLIATFLMHFFDLYEAGIMLSIVIIAGATSIIYLILAKKKPEIVGYNEAELGTDEYMPQEEIASSLASSEIAENTQESSESQTESKGIKERFSLFEKQKEPDKLTDLEIEAIVTEYEPKETENELLDFENKNKTEDAP